MPKNHDFTFTVNVYNPDLSNAADVTCTLECLKSPDPSDTGETLTGTLTATSTSQTIPPGKNRNFKFTIPKANLKHAWTRECTPRFSDGTDEEVKKVVVNVR
jgi:hypothetical protein